MPGNIPIVHRSRALGPTNRGALARREAADDGEPALAPFNLREVFALLGRHRLAVALCLLLGTGVGGYVAYTTPRRYEATASVRMSETRRTVTGGLSDVGSQAGMVGRDPILSQVEVLTSRQIAARVIDSIPSLRLRVRGFSSVVFDTGIVVPAEVAVDSNLIIGFTFGLKSFAWSARGHSATVAYGDTANIEGLRFRVLGPPKNASDEAALIVIPREDAISALKRGLIAKPRENTDVIDLTVQAGDPRMAQRIVNTTARTFRAANIEAAREQSRLRSQFIEEQLQQNDAQLQDALLALSEYQSRERTLTSTEKFTVEQGQLAILEAQRDQLETDKRRYEEILNRLRTHRASMADPELTILISAVSAAPPGAMPVAPSAAGTPGAPAPVTPSGATSAPSGPMTSLYAEMQRLQNVRDSMTSGPWALAQTNPDVVRIDSMLVHTDQQLQRTVQGLLDATNDRLSSLDKHLSVRSQAIGQLPEKATEDAKLTVRAETYRESARQLREELQKSRLDEAAEVGEVEILDLAPLSRTPIAGGRIRKLLMGVVLGFMLGGGCAFLLEHLNTAIRKREDLELALQLPGLAVIPSFAAGNGRRRRLARGAKSLALRTNGSDPENVLERLIVINNSRSGAAEAYRQLRTKLLFASSVQRLKTLVITSAFAKDGKSTVSANLAVAFAQQGLKVVLIDCDLRNPNQHKIFGAAAEPGLTELLAGQGLVPGTGRRTSVEGLSLITSGTMPIDPAELLGSPRMQEVVDRLSEAFDLVLLDTPPILPVTDALILGQMADGVVLVVRAGQTNKNAAQQALQNLHDVGARVIGAVLNDPDAQVPKYGEYGYYAYYGEGAPR